MKALTLRQPWASLVAEGVKTIETRSWSTTYRGPLAIHAGKAQPVTQRLGDWWCEPTWGAEYGLLNEAGVPYRLPLGAVVCTVTLVDVVPIGARGCLDPTLAMSKGWRNREDQRPFGDFTPGRFAWLLDNIEPLAVPVPARGRQGLWECLIAVGGP